MLDPFTIMAAGCSNIELIAVLFILEYGGYLDSLMSPVIADKRLHLAAEYVNVVK